MLSRILFILAAFLALGSAASANDFKAGDIEISHPWSRATPAAAPVAMTSFDDRIVALRGDKAETDAAVKAFAAYYAKVPTEGGGYTMDHTAGVILMDAKGNFAGTLDMHEPRAGVLEKLRRLAGSDA